MVILEDNLQVPMDYLMFPMLAALAAILGRKIRMYPKQKDLTWVVVPNIYCVIVGGPGARKSPPISNVANLVKPLEKKAKDEFDDALKDYVVADESLETLINGSKAVLKAAVKSQINPVGAQQSLENLLKKKQTKPIEKRYTVGDITIEKLGVCLMGNPNGLLVVVDELASLLANFKKSGREGERAFYLMAANGNDSHRVDRMGRESIYLEGVCISIIGSIQPTVLKKFIIDSLKYTGEDGFIPRFQFMLYPEPVVFDYNDLPLDTIISEKMSRLVERLDSDLVIPPDRNNKDISQNDDESVNLHFDDEAQLIFIEWLKGVYKQSADKSVSPMMSSHLAKFGSLMPSLAVLFFMLEWADSDEDNVIVDGSVRVPKQHALRAAAVCDYLLLHAQKVYEMSEGKTVNEGAKILLRKIAAGDVARVFKRNEVKKKGWSHLNTPDKVNTAITDLEDNGWIRIEQQSSGTGKGGRPVENIVVHPEFDKFYSSLASMPESVVPEFKSDWLDQLTELLADEPVDKLVFDCSAEELFNVKPMNKMMNFNLLH